jgi:hypothetical protein
MRFFFGEAKKEIFAGWCWFSSGTSFVSISLLAANLERIFSLLFYHFHRASSSSSIQRLSNKRRNDKNSSSRSTKINFNFRFLDLRFNENFFPSESLVVVDMEITIR